MILLTVILWKTITHEFHATDNEFKDQKQTGGYKWIQQASKMYDISYLLLNNSIMITIDVN